MPKRPGKKTEVRGWDVGSRVQGLGCGHGLACSHLWGEPSGLAPVRSNRTQAILGFSSYSLLGILRGVKAAPTGAAVVTEPSMT